jgi:hypothetical protein
LDRNRLPVSTETACRIEPKSPAGNSEICKQQELIAVEQLMLEQRVAIATLVGAGMPRLMLQQRQETDQ